MKITRAMVKACSESMGKGWSFRNDCWPAFAVIGHGFDNVIFDAGWSIGTMQIELALAWIVTIGPCDLGD